MTELHHDNVVALLDCKVIIIIITIIIVLVITFMSGIYNYVPETNHFYRVYSFAAVLYLQFVLRIMLFRLWNMFYAFVIIIIIIIIHHYAGYL